MQNNLSQSSFVLPVLTPRLKSSLLKRAEQVLINQQQMITDNGENILHYTLNKSKKHTKYKHYPSGDRIDLKTGGQYFYHCHRENEEVEEHGHFHCYLRKKFIPQYIKPANIPQTYKKEEHAMTHLIAVAMNRIGEPIRLFTPNQWVTSEVWYHSRHAARLTRRFKISMNDDPYWQALDQWIEGILHLFLPQIIWLHKERDRIIKTYTNSDSVGNIYANKNIEEVSEVSINLQEQIEWILAGNT
jgi:hypothetical protein